MTATPDARTGITFFHHVVAGMHIGPMRDMPKGSFASILTVAAQPGRVSEEIRHRHLPLDYQVMDEERLREAVAWTLAQVQGSRSVLIRSERGVQRPALVVGMAILALGGNFSDAMTCLVHANPKAITDFRYRELLLAEDQRIKARLRS